MKKITREEFLKTSSLTVAAAFLSPNLFGKSMAVQDGVDELMLSRLVKANDESVSKILRRKSSTPQRQYYRNLSAAFSQMTAAFSHTKSIYYGATEVLDAMNHILEKLSELQYPNGTLDSAGNRKSPPRYSLSIRIIVFRSYDS